MLGTMSMAGLGGTPPRRIDQSYDPPGNVIAPGSSTGRFRTLIVFGPSGHFVGVFVYSPAPGPGNLIASMAASNGTDPFGNVFFAGEATYTVLGGGQARALVNQGAGLSAFISPTGEGGPYSGAGLLDPGMISVTGLRGTYWGATQSLAVGTHLFGNMHIYGPSGGDDWANLSDLLSAGTSVLLGAGTYQLSAQLTVAGATLAGQDMATVIQPFGGYAGPLLACGAKGVIRNLSVLNGGADAITIAAGIAECWLEDLYFASNAGRCINATITAPAHLRIRGIRGTGGGSANGGGIALNGGTGAAVTCEAAIHDIDIQGLLTSGVLECTGVTDVLADKINGSQAATNTAAALLVSGACQTVHMLGVDCGGSPLGPAVLVVQKGAAALSPTDCIFTGKVQQGAVGTIVSDASARLSFPDWYCTRNQGDGFQASNTGAFNTLTNYLGNQNNLALGVAYDANFTSTGHWLVDGMRGVSGAVTANRNITLAGNHVTVVNDPAGTTVAGNAPAGW